jgi:hypothetical protein
VPAVPMLLPVPAPIMAWPWVSPGG